MKKIYFPNLDGLRFFAFLLVYFQHGFWAYLSALSYMNDSIPEYLFTSFFNGGTGVSIFFVLSGFLITYLILAEKEHTGTIRVIHFYMRRILRIWPLYYAVLVFVFFIYPAVKQMIGIPEEWDYRVVYQFLFISNFDVIRIFKEGLPYHLMGNITWSISIEEQFYLLWPLLFFFFSSRYYVMIFVCIILSSTIFRYLHGSVDNYFHTVSVSSDLAVGGLSAFLVTHSSRFKLWTETLSRKSIYIYYFLAFLWFFFIKDELYFNAFTGSLIRLISALFFAFLILEQNFAIHSFYKCSHNRFITYWGKYTYGLYLLHPIALLIVNNVMVKLLHTTSATLFSALLIGTSGLLMSLIMSWASYEFYEVHFLKLKNRFGMWGKESG